MKFSRTEFSGVILAKPQIHSDPRGYFYESYRKDLFVKNGIDCEFVQDNQSLSKRGTLRGLHYQIPPMAQAKLVRVLKGEIFDAIVDLRKKEPTYGRVYTCRLSAEDPTMLFVPEGFAHGFCALADNTEVLYKVSRPYSKKHECGIHCQDPKLNISWPSLKEGYCLSSKDAEYPPFSKAVLPW